MDLIADDAEPNYRIHGTGVNNTSVYNRRSLQSLSLNFTCRGRSLHMILKWIFLHEPTACGVV